MKKIQVLIADGSRLFAEALRSVIEKAPDFAVPFDAGTGVDAIRAVQTLNPDIVAAGQILPDMSMAQVIRETRRLSKSTAFLFTINESSPELMRLLGETERIGAVPQSAGIDEFMTALRSVARGERYVSQSIIDQYNAAEESAPPRDMLDGITPREREVLYWMAHGLTNSEISAKMILSEKTVKNHVSHILKKLEVADRTKAAAIAWRDGLPLIPEDFFQPDNVSSIL